MLDKVFYFEDIISAIFSFSLCVCFFLLLAKVISGKNSIVLLFYQYYQ